MNLFLLSLDANAGTASTVSFLKDRYWKSITTSGLEDLPATQLLYAMRLADSSGPLLYEELHKLFSLCDETHALRTLGFQADPTLHERFELAVRSRFHRQSAEARLVAEDKAAAWNADLWWYAELLAVPE